MGAVHHLREALNASGPEKPIPAELLAAYDAPVVAGAIKLWLLELNPPIALWEGWEEMRKLYPTGEIYSIFAKFTFSHKSSISWLGCC